MLQKLERFKPWVSEDFRSLFRMPSNVSIVGSSFVENCCATNNFR